MISPGQATDSVGQAGVEGASRNANAGLGVAFFRDCEAPWLARCRLAALREPVHGRLALTDDPGGWPLAETDRLKVLVGDRYCGLGPTKVFCDQWISGAILARSARGSRHRPH
jgi:hypothetical protein